MNLSIEIKTKLNKKSWGLGFRKEKKNTFLSRISIENPNLMIKIMNLQQYQQKFKLTKRGIWVYRNTLKTHHKIKKIELKHRSNWKQKQKTWKETYFGYQLPRLKGCWKNQLVERRMRHCERMRLEKLIESWKLWWNHWDLSCWVGLGCSSPSVVFSQTKNKTLNFTKFNAIKSPPLFSLSK